MGKGKVKAVEHLGVYYLRATASKFTPENNPLQAFLCSLNYLAITSHLPLRRAFLDVLGAGEDCSIRGTWAVTLFFKLPDCFLELSHFCSASVHLKSYIIIIITVHR